MRVSQTFLLCTATLALAASPSYADLIGYYPLSTGANDASGHGNNGTFSNPSPTLVPNAGHDGQNAYLFGAGSSLTVPLDNRPISSPAVTMGGWFKPSTTTPVQTLISIDKGGYDRELDIDSRGGSTSWSAFTGNGVLGSGITPSTTAWTFVAVTYDQSNSSVVLTVNNQNFSSTTNFDPDAFTTTTIGQNAHFTNEYFTGLIQDVFFYNSALTQQQLQDIRQNGVQVSTTTPEPASLALAGFGMIGVGCIARRRKRIR